MSNEHNAHTHTPSHTPTHAHANPFAETSFPADRRALIAGIGGLAAGALLLSARSAHAGPLTPPAGPVTGTYKTLAEVEPRTAISVINTPGTAISLFKITQPGSYYLTNNITGVVGKHGIEIAASGVTLDLMGFEMLGIAGSLDGISAIGLSVVNVTVRNGSIRAWGGDGIDLTATSSSTCAVTDVIASDNAAVGISVPFISTITNCIAEGNGSHGLRCLTAGIITSCVMRGNANNGMFVDSNCVITGCSANNNGSDGIQAGGGCTITGCSASENTGNGIVQNTAGTINNCAANDNNAGGIRTNDGCIIVNCTARFNTLDGIYVTDTCIVQSNTCSFNGNAGVGAGIRVFGTDNRIEGNNCYNADRGIQVDVAGNFIARNTCSNNTINWQIAIGNVCLVVLATPTAAVIFGDSGGLSPGSTNPNANFTY